MGDGDVTRRELWGYAVWSALGVVVGVPEIWAVGHPHAPWPTISGTVAQLEYSHPWVAIVVVGVIVFAGYHALRYPAEKTGVLPNLERDGTTTTVASLAPGVSLNVGLNRTAGGRLTCAAVPTREIGAVLYFPFSLAVIAAGCIVVHEATPDRHRFGQALYGLLHDQYAKQGPG